MIGAIEAGGTKFICAVASLKGDLIESIKINTTHPEETMEKVFTFFKAFEKIESFGISCFGPIDVNPSSPTYGYILNTPKKAWRNFPFLKTMRKQFPTAQFAWTTDVNGAAFGEYRRGSAQKVESCLYLTVGTGVGGGIISKGQIYQNTKHPEVGHILVRRNPQDLAFKGVCPTHGDCLEGLVAGPALKARTGIEGQDIEQNHPVWKLVSDYLAQAMLAYTYIAAPDIIIMGGGVAEQTHLFPLIHQRFRELNNYYFDIEAIQHYIVPTGLGSQSGIIGSIEMAKDLLNS